MKVPAFLLRRLYVKGSLSATKDGFTFQLRNRLGSGYARSLKPLTLDGAELDTAVTTFENSGGSLASGPHKIGMRFEVAGLGELGFDFSDVIF